MMNNKIDIGKKKEKKMHLKSEKKQRDKREEPALLI